MKLVFIMHDLEIREGKSILIKFELNMSSYGNLNENAQ